MVFPSIIFHFNCFEDEEPTSAKPASRPRPAGRPLIRIPVCPAGPISSRIPLRVHIDPREPNQNDREALDSARFEPGPVIFIFPGRILFFVMQFHFMSFNSNVIPFHSIPLYSTFATPGAVHRPPGRRPRRPGSAILILRTHILHSATFFNIQ